MVPVAVKAPDTRDPSFPTQDKYLSYVDIFVDDFMALVQGRLNKRRLRRILLRAINQVFHPLSKNASDTRREPVSIKKL